MTLHVQIVTPERTLIDTEADQVVLPTVAGEITVLPQHVPVLTALGPGEVVLTINGREEHVVVVGGFVEISPKEVKILADYAIHGKDINEVSAREAKERAEKAMKEATNDRDYATANAEFLRAIQELKVAGKIKHTNH